MKITPNQKEHEINYPLDSFLSQISPEIAATFTKEQIEAINKSFQSRESNEHFINLRISVLVPLISFYLVLLVGKERRSKQRLQYERSLYPIWTFGNSFLIIVFSFFILSGGIYTLFVAKSLISTKPQVAFPTSIPWIKNQDDCERGNRTWKDNKCWDSQHSSDF